MMSKVAEINACGPFPHGYFDFEGHRFSHEGPLAGRATFLARKAIEFLDSVAREQNIPKEKLQILEIGSYDGWISHKIWEEGYRRITTLEPRRHNITRGRRLRRILKEKDGVRHVLGTLSTPPPRLRWRAIFSLPYDCVISFGVIHHLDDPMGFVRSVRRFARYSVLLEGVTLSDGLVGDKIVAAIEPKDIVYRGKPLVASIYGVKLESGYLPGSRVGTGTVMIPGVTAFRWAMEAVGFSPVIAKPGFEEFRNLTGTHRKNLNTTVFRGEVQPRTHRRTGQASIGAHVRDEEEVNCRTALRGDVLNQIELAVAAYDDPYNPRLRKILIALSKECETPSLILNIIHAPVTKTNFERVKEELARGEDRVAITRLRQIVETPCDDWRSFYRALFLLSERDTAQKRRWRRLLRLSNPEFPEKLLRL